MSNAKTKSRLRSKALSSSSLSSQGVSLSRVGIPSLHAKEIQEGSPRFAPWRSTPRKSQKAGAQLMTPQMSMMETLDPKKSVATQLYEEEGTNESILKHGVEYDYTVQSKSEYIYMHRYSSSLSFSHGEPLPKSSVPFSPTRSPLLGKRPITTLESCSRPAKVIRRHRSSPPIKRPAGQYESSENEVPNKKIPRTTVKMRKESNDQMNDKSVHADASSFGGAFSMASDALSHRAGPPSTGTSMHFRHPVEATRRAPVSQHEGRVHGRKLMPMLDGGVSLGKKPAKNNVDAAGASTSSARSSKSSRNIEKPSSSARRS